MKDAWEDREKALENGYFHRQEQQLIEQMKKEAESTLIKSHCHNCCPKCGEQLKPVSFRGVPLDRCVNCGGVWLGPNDLKILAQKDHRTWFDHWFGQEENHFSEEDS
ncbi:zf-TFIIB domain-containing protein [Geopsychrobacter electrodiphilus]|uniref:TFIIB-type zinc ribbon-containing protein n=1 Tax=Geopsychrobacter electrodiphilus TaxID=225196 RepID=UPI0003815BA2|nr:zf-TFIIB domain-containing protein [Geopsychrobacter electrodiphilus]